MSKHHYFLIALFALLSSGCPFGQEPEDFKYDSFVSNESSSSVIIYIYDLPNNPPLDSVRIEPGGTEIICFYIDNFYAQFGCLVGALKFFFENGKGYYCEKGIGGINTTENCFLMDKDPFLSRRLPENGNGTIFTITQEDFENAYEL